MKKELQKYVQKCFIIPILSYLIHSGRSTNAIYQQQRNFVSRVNLDVLVAQWCIELQNENQDHVWLEGMILKE